MENQDIYLYQSFSPPESIDTGTGLFPQAPGVTLSDGVILYTWRDDAYGSDSSGTGLFDPFLTLQSNAITESGSNFYNGGSYGTGDALSSGDSRTSSIKANLIPVVEYGGLEYYEIRLDVNEVNGPKKGLVDLDSFKIFGSDSATQGSGGGSLIYSLDTTSINKTIHIFDDSTGSGKSDIVMLIPKSYFSSNPEYLYFEASLSGNDGGFEEFSVRVLAVDPPIAALTITKVASTDTVDNAGDVINYTITVANAGNVTLTGVVLTDEFATATLFSGDDDSDSELDVGESWVYTASHSVTQDDMDAGTDILNLAIADTDQTDASQDDAVTAVLQNAALTITKVASTDTVDNAGDVINYTITVANAGNVTLTGVVLTDEFATATLFSGDDDSDSELDVGESWVYTASHSVTQDDMDAGTDILNLAIADTDQTDASQDDAVTAVLQNAALTITKVASTDTVDNAGDVINYTITVANAGNVTLTGVVLTDEFATATLFSGDDDSDSELDVGESWVYTASHSVTQDDMDAGTDILNLAIADTDQTDASQDDAVTAVLQNAALTITKVASTDTVDNAGDVINYTITVANAGNVTLTGVVLTDEFATATLFSGDDDSDSELDVGESWVYTASHSVTQDDMDAGTDILNLAIADTDQTDASQDDAVTAVLQNAALTITKVASTDTVDNAGDVINYTITVANAGNVTLTGVVLTDEFATATLFSGDDDSDSELDVGESWVYTASHSVTQDDMDAGTDILNLAIADTDQTDASQDDAVTAVLQNAALTITKVASTDTVDNAGDVINYTITVANAGNVTLTGVVLTDEFATATLFSGDDDSDSELDVGESWVYTASHSVTQDDMDAGTDILNLAIADTDQTDASQDDAVTAVLQNAALTITKVASTDTVDNAGDVINYTITVANAGNVTLTGVVLTDEFATATLFSGDDDSDSELDVGESWVYTASHSVTQDDMDAGTDILNLAIADTDQTDASQDDAVTAVLQNAALTITKVASTDTVDNAGDVINYTITVANAGNVTLTGVVLTDEFATATLFSGDDDSDSELDVGESWVYTASHSVTQDDMDAGTDILNLAIADTDQTDASQDDAVTAVLQNAALTITKVASTDTVDNAGDVINYTITVANAGNVTLTGVVLTDEFATATLFSGDDDSDSELDVGESWVYTASHSVTQDDMDAGTDILNLAIADTDQTDASQDDAVTAVLQAPDLSITKMANVNFVDEAGDTILYTITVENEGNITLNGVVVLDPMLTGSLTNDWNQDSMIDGDANNNGALDIGEAWVWTGEYIVTQADIDAARATNDPYTINNTAYADSDQTGIEEASETVGVNFEGLSHGYWKTHSSDWDGVTTGTSFENFFFGSQQGSLKWLVKNNSGKAEKFTNANDITFSQALALTGGNEAALAREAVASILNIRDEDVTYRFTESQVKEWVSEALSNQAVDINNDGINEFAAGADAITGVKNLLEFNNNLELV